MSKDRCQSGGGGQKRRKRYEVFQRTAVHFSSAAVVLGGTLRPDNDGDAMSKYEHYGQGMAPRRRVGRPTKSEAEKEANQKAWAEARRINTSRNSIERRIELLAELNDRHAELLGARDSDGLMALAEDYRRIHAERIAERIIKQAARLSKGHATQSTGYASL